MRDTPMNMLEFVKIIERFPAVYDSSKETYRTRIEWEKSWDQIVNCVRTEMNEPCSVDELRARWKGIRSSFNRYKHKILNAEKCKKYYLYDALKYLDPFTRATKQAFPSPGPSQSHSANDETFGDNSVYSPVDYSQWEEDDDKTGIVLMNEDNEQHNNIEANYASDSNKSEEPDQGKKRKLEKDGINIELEYLQFFQNIMPDLQNYTQKEKRKFKIGVLKLIDEIEEAREKDIGGSEAKVNN